MSKMKDWAESHNKLYCAGDNPVVPATPRPRLPFEEAVKRLPSNKEEWKYWGTMLVHGEMCHVWKHRTNPTKFEVPCY